MSLKLVATHWVRTDFSHGDCITLPEDGWIELWGANVPGLVPFERLARFVIYAVSGVKREQRMITKSRTCAQARSSGYGRKPRLPAEHP